MNSHPFCKSWNRIPSATCRIQFNASFPVKHAIAYIAFLKNLGISDIYSSPLFRSAPNSTHGYDTCNFNALNSEVGTPEEFGDMFERIKANSMGLLLDMVPNHMAACVQNRWWFDVLKYGKDSQYAHYFDIDWNRPGFPGKVLLPVLGDHYSTVLENGDLHFKKVGDDYVINYFETELPVAPSTYPPNDKLTVDALDQLIQKQHYRLAFWRVASEEINYRRFFDITSLVSIRVEDTNVFNDSHKLLFDLVRNGSITGLRIDHPDGLRDPAQYFERLQSKLKEGSECFYLVVEKILSDSEKLPKTWPVAGSTGYDFLNYLNGAFVAPENELAFTSIYNEFLTSEFNPEHKASSQNRNNGSQRIDERELERKGYDECVRTAKRQILESSLASEVHQLALRLKDLASNTREGFDLTFKSLHRALIGTLTSFPVYRTYFAYSENGDNLIETPLTEIEVTYINTGCNAAERELSDMDKPALEFLRKTLLRSHFSQRSKEFQRDSAEFIVRFQQLSGPATAKGLEDTTFYRYVRFISLNEVGGNPGKFGVSLEDFHGFNQCNQQNWPHTMISTATHDTKRGEDVRARLNVISEVPEEWRNAVIDWHELNFPFLTQHKNNPSPSRNDEYLIYQTIVGTWPLGKTEKPGSEYCERIKAYMQKAMREAKMHTAWTEVNEQYEAAVQKFIDEILSSQRFLEKLNRFVARISEFGLFNSLAQVVLKNCSPGVPDLYQGNELWDFHLVDPDNRRPISVEERIAVLSRLEKIQASESMSLTKSLLDKLDSGEIKLFTTWKCLNFRKKHPALFSDGEYQPLSVTGPAQGKVVGFKRMHGSSELIVAVPRFLSRVATSPSEALQTRAFQETLLKVPKAAWKNIFTEEMVASEGRLNCAEAFRHFPMVVLARE
ncbi:MAG: malto-oligosyltrehalose synthase [Verrucomicrobiota bacterium]